MELHTGNATLLLRETMDSLGQKLDPAGFAPYSSFQNHQPRFRILELRSIENHEYIVKLELATDIGSAILTPTSSSVGSVQRDPSRKTMNRKTKTPVWPPGASICGCDICLVRRRRFGIS